MNKINSKLHSNFILFVFLTYVNRDNKFLTPNSIDMISESLTHMARLKELTLDMQSMDLSNKAANKFFSRLQSLHTIEVLTIILK